MIPRAPLRGFAGAIGLIASAVWLLGASPPPAVEHPDPGATKAVNDYVSALERQDYAAAFALLPSSQQSYFGDVANFASNPQSTQYRIKKFAIVSALSHGDIIEFTVHEDVSFVNVGTQRTISAGVKEPYFALRDNGVWRVKQLYQPWKSYAPEITGTAQGVSVTVHRIQFFDKRIQIDCTVRNDAKTPVQVLPLGKSVLDDGATKTPALDTAAFPLNSLAFFEGFRLLPRYESSGYINFPVTEKKDADRSFTLTIAPAVFDGVDQTFGVVVGPIQVKKL
ncbi:MAG: hypothetical protein JO293_08375 [Candidatus Eremiobacteraeota bacterium]|nr:hypothetical protein [Candidatus Eremiobacteraeota bacterium]